MSNGRRLNFALGGPGFFVSRIRHVEQETVGAASPHVRSLRRSAGRALPRSPMFGKVLCFCFQNTSRPRSPHSGRESTVKPDAHSAVIALHQPVHHRSSTRYLACLATPAQGDCSNSWQDARSPLVRHSLARSRASPSATSFCRNSNGTNDARARAERQSMAPAVERTGSPRVHLVPSYRKQNRYFTLAVGHA